ncbi:GGDEF domain-containing protein [Acidiferrobacter thiooxydans]|uniref:GGDEF domain-containing protein n=2 Tax=Acidiferrobacter thiooxydans TaxID=163359 RepID=A0A368HD56_9GAMM|nr:GGDEF domain-containing protein [Acidiferrobacter thiooxydans]
MRLSHFIMQNLESILVEWEKFAATLVPESQRADQAMLRDHVRKMLETIAADLARPESAHDQAEKSKGHRPATKTAATTHGVERLELGFSLVSAMAEYRALRASVTRLWQDAHIAKPVSKTANEDIIRFNEAIDQAVSESVDSYSAERDKQTRVFETILSSSPDLSFTFDLEGRFAYANKALIQLLGRPIDKIVGTNFFDLHFSAAAEMQGHIQQAIASKQQFRGDMPYTAPGREVEFFDFIFAPVHTNGGKVEAVAGTARNITNRKIAENRNWQKANYDLLTGLPNRRLLGDRLNQSVKHTVRTGVQIALLFIDLDHFKEANDRFGHDSGDILVRLVADRIRSCVRAIDTVARLGGDEFTVILQDLTDNHHVEISAKKILNELATPFQINNNVIHISGTIGIALCPQDASTAEQLLKNADQAMYMAKIAGRNRFHFFLPSQEQSVEPISRLITDLRVALPSQQLDVYYQPIVDIATGRIVKAEALLRWHHPELGLMVPGQFMGPAEEAVVMDEIGNWVVTEAARHSRLWGELLGMPFQINFNLSANQFIDHNYTSTLGAYIKSLGLAPHSLSVDIKEESFLNEWGNISDRIVALHDAGIDVAVDDFGSGYSSIAHLKIFAIDTIKIDRSLIRDMTGDVSNESVLQAIIAMAHKLGIKVIAEGVETITQRVSLQSADCDYAQGYLFSTPVRADEFEKLLQPG